MEYNKYEIMFEQGSYSITVFAKDIQSIIGPKGTFSIMIHDPRPDTDFKIINADRVLFVRQIHE